MSELDLLLQQRADPLDKIRIICDYAPDDALSRIAEILGDTHPAEALPEHVDIDSVALDLMQKIWAIGNRHGPDSQRKAQIQCCIADFLKGYTTPDATRVPDGYALVPREATEKMLEYAVSYALNVSIHGEGGWSKYMAEVWRRMLLAATPPSGAVSDHIVDANKMDNATLSGSGTLSD